MREDADTYRKALEDFRKIRSKSALKRFWSGVKGESLDLLPYDEVSAKLRAVSQTDRGLQQIPLKQIIGSVNRLDDFDRNFRPLNDSDSTRWASVKTAMTSPFSPGVPPISVYQIGDVYFVLDGNHRVSIAKQMGFEDIEAYVTEIKTKVPLPVSITAEELVVKAAYADFLEDTHIDTILPGVDLSLNSIDRYRLLKEHILVHQYYMGLEQNREISYEEAVLHWYDHVYLPVVSIIESSGLRDEFIHSTITDLYLWVLDRQTSLQEWLGLPLKTSNVLDYAAQQEGHASKADLTPAQLHINDILRSTGGQDQQPDAASANNSDCLFQDILVALSDSDPDYVAMDQAVLINRCPNGSIRGVHVLGEGKSVDSAESQVLQKKFDDRLWESGMRGKLVYLEGDITRILEETSLLSDLLVMKLNYPPGGNLLGRFSSGIITILQKSRRPILFVKDKPQPFTSILLLYDGNVKSKEALYISAYYAAKFGTRLHLYTPNDGTDSETAAEARDYLRKLHIESGYTPKTAGSQEEVVGKLIEEHQVSTLILGGYVGSSIFDRLFRSSVDQLLTRVEMPILICQ